MAVKIIPEQRLFICDVCQKEYNGSKSSNLVIDNESYIQIEFTVRSGLCGSKGDVCPDCVQKHLIEYVKNLSLPAEVPAKDNIHNDMIEEAGVVGRWSRGRDGRINVEGYVHLTQDFFVYNKNTKKYDARFKFDTITGEFKTEKVSSKVLNNSNLLDWYPYSYNGQPVILNA
jgi:hypothetical protein